MQVSIAPEYYPHISHETRDQVLDALNGHFDGFQSDAEDALLTIEEAIRLDAARAYLSGQSKGACPWKNGSYARDLWMHHHLCGSVTHGLFRQAATLDSRVKALKHLRSTLGLELKSAAKRAEALKQTICNEGALAFNNGLSSDACPWPSKTYGQDCWQEGWDKAKNTPIASEKSEMERLRAENEAYKKAMNRIDDWFEYANESPSDRKRVHEILSELNTNLAAI
ncbi:hypothetical protein [Neptuniibacter sp. QD37_11]|uniref:hypothetical protein n=1 Tax=Neptuniibacter sp. QD37_11 TaxID=3398209 RepID=UPI0039F49D02